MTLLFAISTALRLIAVVWSAWLLHRHKQWRIGLLTLLLAALAAEHVAIWTGYRHHHLADGISLIESVSLGPHVTVSILTVLVVLGIDQALRQTAARSEAHFRRLADEVPTPVVITQHDDGRIVYANEPALRLFGGEAEAIIGISAATLYADPRQRRELLAAVEGHGSVRGFELRLRLHSGEIRWMSLSARRIQLNREPALISALFDITDRKQAEEQTRESEQRFRGMFEGSPDAVFVESEEGRILDVNPKACELHGMTREQLLDTHVLDLVPADRRASVRRDYRKVVDGQLKHVEGYSLHADGREIPVEINIGRIDHAGRPALLLHVRDITERRQIEERFRESERMLAKAQQIAAVGSFSRDLTNDQLMASRQFYRIFGFDPERDRLHSIEQIIQRVHPEDRDRIREALHTRLRRGITVPLEYRVQTPDGLIRHVLGQSEVIFNAQGKPLRSIGTVQDITDMKRTEQRIRENEARLRLLLQQLPAVLWTTDDMLRFTSSMGSGLHLLGLAGDQVAGRTLYEHFETDDPEHLAIAAHLTALKGDSDTFEYEAGSNTFQVFIDPLRDPDGRIVGTIGLALDITDRKKAERRQTMMMQELDHRVKNNLAAVISLAEQSLGRAATLEEFRRTFTGRIMAMSRTHAALARAHWEGAELRDLIRLTIEPYNAEDQQRVAIEGPRVMLPAAAALPCCMAIHELATNAVKYGALSTDAGRVELQWLVRDGWVIIHWRESGGPPVTPPERRGFGTRFIESGIAYQIDGEVKLHFDPAGVRCQIRLPSDGQPSAHTPDTRPLTQADTSPGTPAPRSP